jgi:hypothetical protein
MAYKDLLLCCPQAVWPHHAQRHPQKVPLVEVPLQKQHRKERRKQHFRAAQDLKHCTGIKQRTRAAFKGIQVIECET